MPDVIDLPLPPLPKKSDGEPIDKLAEALWKAIGAATPAGTDANEWLACLGETAYRACVAVSGGNPQRAYVTAVTLSMGIEIAARLDLKPPAGHA
jgi:hypothetical protein